MAIVLPTCFLVAAPFMGRWLPGNSMYECTQCIAVVFFPLPNTMTVWDQQWGENVKSDQVNSLDVMIMGHN